MAPTTLEPNRKPRMIPVRACHRCDAVEDVFHLTMVDRFWLCRTCHKSLSFPGQRVAARVVAEKSVTEEANAPTIGLHTPQSARGDSVAARLHRIDRTLRWGGFALRIVIYGLFLMFASKYPLAENLLLGFFVADSFGWVLHAWSDAHFHGRAITAEAVFYTLLFVVMQSSGLLDMPTGIEARFLAVGTGTLTIGWQLTRFWYKLRIAQPE